MELPNPTSARAVAERSSLGAAERGDGWLTPGKVLGFLAAYFALHALLRVLVSDSAELDESHQLLVSQSWSWGYGSDPPLYTWLQILFFHLFGTSILALALLKNVLLFLTALFTYCAGREAAGKRAGLLAALSILLFPAITWESQRDLTHSVLASAIAAATFWVAVRTWKSGKLVDYALLGLCLGLGALSKYSYCLVAVALGLAALTLPDLRRALLRPAMGLTLLIAIVMLAWHVRWILLRPDLALIRARQVLPLAGQSLWHARLVGLFSVPQCVVTVSAALCAGYWIAFRRIDFFRRCSGERGIVHGWIGRTFLLSFVLAGVVAVGWGVQLRDRWFQPIVFLAAIGAALGVQQSVNAREERRFFALIAAIAGVVLVILPGIPLAAAVTHRPTRLNAPYKALCAKLKAAVPPPGTFLTPNRLVAGNLRLSFPDRPVLAPESNFLPPSREGPVVVVWDATRIDVPSPELVSLVQRSTQVDLRTRPPSFLEAPFLYTNARHMKMAYVVLP